MPQYDPITNTMPVASMVTNAVVSAALCDQIRDDLVALYDGWWFRATVSTGGTLTLSSSVAFSFDTISMSQSAEDEGSIAIVGGNVRLRKTGLWLLGGNWSMVSGHAGIIAATVNHTDSAVGLCEYVNDSSNTKTAISCSGTVNQTSASATASFNYYTTNSGSTAGANVSTTFWGVWLGANP